TPNTTATPSGTQRFEQIPKHKPPNNWGSPGVLNDADAAKAVNQAVEIKPGMRAIKLADGRVLIFRNASKKPSSPDYKKWHGGWEANPDEMKEVAKRMKRTPLPTFVP